MHVRVLKNLLQAEPEYFKKKPFDCDRHYIPDYITVNLHNFNRKDLEKFRSICAEHSKLKGVSAIWKDIGIFMEMVDDKSATKKIKARTVNGACKLIVEHMNRFCERKHVYEPVDEGDSRVNLCYFVDEVIYHPPKRERDYTRPEYIHMGLVWFEFGRLRTRHVDFIIRDCIGKTPKQILMEQGLIFESEALRSDYEKHMEDFDQWNDKIGMQFWAKGDAKTMEVEKDEDDEYYWRKEHKEYKLDIDGIPTRVVVDVINETEKKKEERDSSDYDRFFWTKGNFIKFADDELSGKYVEGDNDDDSDILAQEDEENKQAVEIPTHPYVVAFDLKKHKRFQIHVANLTPYEYDTEIRDKLVLPDTNGKLIDVLLSERGSKFKDIIAGKTGGMIIICQGPPGTGKTLTAEVYAETMKRPLYTVQCSQLGTDPDTLEKNLMMILKRGNRWDAVTLLDEADVYVHERGNDLTQNAIVGVFLRVLEYHSGVLFLTTNRGDLVDDAILSRCTARIPYNVPDITQQHRIWKVLAETNEIPLKKKVIQEIVDAHPKLSGRDIKNLLKIAAMVAHDRGVEIDEELIDEMLTFKPTFTSIEEKD